MNDEDLLEQAASCRTVYFDGIGAYRNINGVLRCVGFILGGGAQLNMIISLAGAELANSAARRVLDEAPTKHSHIWNGPGLAH